MMSTASINKSGINPFDIQEESSDTHGKETKTPSKSSKSSKKDSTPKVVSKIMKEEKKSTRSRKTAISKNDDADPDVEAERQKKIMVIQRYYKSKRFGDYLRDVVPQLSVKQLEKKSISDLDGIIKRLGVAVSNKNGNDFIEGAVNYGVGLVELSLHDVYNCDGLSAVLKQNDNWNDALEQLILDNQILVLSDPKYRMAMILTTSIIQVHETNKILQNMSAEQIKDLTSTRISKE